VIAAPLFVAFMMSADPQAAAAPPAAPASPAAAAPAHTIAFYADLDDPAAARAVIVLRAFVEAHPGVAVVEVHPNPPAGRARPVDRALVAARGLNAGLQMAELILVNRESRTAKDFLAMARQLRLDATKYQEALASPDLDAAIADDVAAAASLKGTKGAALLIDGEPLATEVTLAALESRLTAGW
jgi:hypothetical protein